jgi:hypothetical protein
MGIFANTADAGGVRRDISENGGVGIAAVEDEYQGALSAAGA